MGPVNVRETRGWAAFICNGSPAGPSTLNETTGLPVVMPWLDTGRIPSQRHTLNRLLGNV